MKKVGGVVTEKTRLTENIKYGWYKKTLLTQNIRQGFHEKSLSAKKMLRETVIRNIFLLKILGGIGTKKMT